MAKQRKRTGRVTPKGTKDPNREKQRGGDVPKAAVTHQRDLPDRVRHTRAFAGRPTSHNRGNR